MTGRAAETWTTYRESVGDRSGLFAALAETRPIERALYPGCYLDLAPSTAIREVVYVDTDRRARRFFADVALVREELAGRTAYDGPPTVRFVAGDYREALPVDERYFDLLISLYAGPVWESAGRYLRPGGWLLANNSHGDASLAALDARLVLEAAVISRGDRYRLETERLDSWLVPRRPGDLDAELVRQRGRGVAFTRTAFAYLFRVVA